MKNLILKNGIRVICDHLETVETTTLGIFIGSGSKKEEEHEHGITHFIEHMLFKSNAFYNKNEGLELIENTGALVNGFTTKEYMCIYSKSLKKEAISILNVLYKMMTSPTFLEEEIEIEKKVISNEIARSNDNKYNIVHENMMKLLYPSQNISKNILGTYESINSFNRERLSSFYSNILETSDIVISLSGHIEPKLIKEVEILFESFTPRKEALNSVKKAIPDCGKEIGVELNNSQQNYLSLGYPTDTYYSSNLSSIMVFNQLLGGGRTSFLNRNIRDKLGMVYSSGSTVYTFQEGGIFSINISSSVNNDIFQIKELILNMVSNDLAKEIVDEKIAIAKSQLKSKLLFGLENSTSRMLEFGKNAILNLDNKLFSSINHNDIKEVVKLLDSVNANKVKTLYEGFLNVPPTASVITCK